MHGFTPLSGQPKIALWQKLQMHRYITTLSAVTLAIVLSKVVVKAVRRMACVFVLGFF